ncbi:apolipoprotein(a)-like isoform X2 [Ruditapes philippinarum]|uniref:apolipoprotein(a)-like isoform X2 n=1 Tax=Ruditapes philippinarum TaxID=129788 RepID=UPI00295BE846|nr:apolipoprotein(a)-like isoform X2 [Ruditapes philippinarum]
MILLFYLTVSAYSVLGFQTPCYYGTTANYSGYLNVTVTLFHCERWDAHISDVNSTWDFSVDGSIEKAGSYCRDPNSSGQLWCYSTNPVRKVENCSIVACEDAAVSKSYQLIRGDNKTAMLKSFDDVWRCHYIPDDGCFMTEKTLCVMFATDGETCLKYMCCVNRGCYEGSTSTYTEDWEHTYTYKECHKWALIPPSMLIYTQFNSSAHITQSNNYCRDMVNDGVLYCFTEEFEKVSCGIPSCSEQASMNKYPHSCYNITLKDRISVGLPGNATEKQVCESLTDKSYINSTSEEVLGCQGCKCCQRDAMKKILEAIVAHGHIRRPVIFVNDGKIRIYFCLILTFLQWKISVDITSVPLDVLQEIMRRTGVYTCHVQSNYVRMIINQHPLWIQGKP